MSSDLPSSYELGKLIGRYDESMKNIDTTLKTIDGKLEKGEKKMNGLEKKIDDGFHDQKLENGKIHNDIDNTKGSLQTHKDKNHLYKITDVESRFTRAKRHWAEILLGSIGSIITLLIMAKQGGLI